MEVGASMAMQSRAPRVGAGAAGGRRSVFLGCEKQARAGSLRVGAGTAGAAVVAVRARGTKPVAPLRCVRASPGSESLHNSVDEALLLKRKSEEVLLHLNGRCINLVGMMGSGKSTVGKILAEVLGYSFFDSDKLVEQAVGMPSVAQIFKVHSEAFFRENESNVLRGLSSMWRLVVATGGGAVIRPINWNYMKKGLSVWLDVPLDALAKRIAQVGTASRPLLDQPSDDPYTVAFTKLSMLAEQRGEAYANADARVSLEEIAAKQGHGDVSKLTPTDIAIEALLQIGNFVNGHPTIHGQVGDLQVDSQSRRIRTS
ncbi:shikimate kinase 2, chloroplastic-like [Panicum virgatum]|uniref:shikimate kinase 2, chloroplastic-like n=1 Tax=Panicum virgatum TaxID=38727 RepID=UPI0019D5A398|nr:shikimate kinase 2, chloroplastic-like [Panicum virgatum]